MLRSPAPCGGVTCPTSGGGWGLFALRGQVLQVNRTQLLGDQPAADRLRAWSGNPEARGRVLWEGPRMAQRSLSVPFFQNCAASPNLGQRTGAAEKA